MSSRSVGASSMGYSKCTFMYVDCSGLLAPDRYQYSYIHWIIAGYACCLTERVLHGVPVGTGHAPAIRQRGQKVGLLREKTNFHGSVDTYGEELLVAWKSNQHLLPETRKKGIKRKRDRENMHFTTVSVSIVAELIFTSATCNVMFHAWLFI